MQKRVQIVQRLVLAGKLEAYTNKQLTRPTAFMELDSSDRKSRELTEP